VNLRLSIQRHHHDTDDARRLNEYALVPAMRGCDGLDVPRPARARTGT
jgi:hypothetical protein